MKNKTKVMDESYIKFKCRWEKTPPFEKSKVSEINAWRNRLYAAGLLGAHPDGVGFGNISMRTSPSGRFIITGSATGKRKILDGSGYSEVSNVDFENNTVECAGPVMPSSESMTHAAVYAVLPEINAVMHIHSGKMWNELKGKIPQTGEDAPYGTPEIAFEVMRVLRENPDLRIIVIGGHKDGLLSFGRDFDEAWGAIKKHLGGDGNDG